MRSDSKTQIRPATPIDIDRIAAWQVAMARETENKALDLKVVTGGVTHVFDHPSIGYYLIAEIENEPVGCCLMLSEWSDWRNGHVLWIHSVYVEPAHRKSRVFRSIYDHLEAKVSGDPAIFGLRLYVDKSNAKAISAYQAVGMNGDHYQLFESMK